MIVTLTLNPSVDATSEVEGVVPDNKLRCRAPTFEPGGGGINVSRAIRRLGGSSLALFTCGGLYGEMLHRMLNQERISALPIPIAEATRENLIVVEMASGKQFRFDMPGPFLKEREWRLCLDKLSEIVPKPDYIVASGSLPPGVPDDFYARVADIARKRRCRVIVDTSGKALGLAVRSGVYLLKPNMRELRELTGKEIKGELELKEAAQRLIKQGGCEVVVVSLGAAGALLITKEIFKHFRSPTVPIQSKVGAGDSMVGGIVLSLAEGRTIEEAALFGVAAGAAAVMNPKRELCRSEDTEELFRKLTRQTNSV